MAVYLIDLEPVDTRYTAQWRVHLPSQMRNAGLDVIEVSGSAVPQTTTPGAFLNFAGTNNVLERDSRNRLLSVKVCRVLGR